ncbi:hypothetical protein DEJ28_08240 [Curtobacterium sp. MCPF17_002]|uniref:hypothetical protein n=1 Tax=Curtobacterium sp. MCPF17_002 TaxID=2175645 RepID=UPI000DAA7206|nr:hypothetical protein [Curtobacterium sp. MCPF17_002]WIB79077.1 hypothetical protein DEJ28_08240 [Curtobacterium sp. MCPF17_002]
MEQTETPVLRSRVTLAWILPTLALVLLAAQMLACVLTYVHTAPIDGAYDVGAERGRGLLHARSADVTAAGLSLGLTWIATVPVALAATLLAASAIDRFRAEGKVRVYAQSVTLVGILGCIAGVVLAVLGVLELLRG